MQAKINIRIFIVNSGMRGGMKSQGNGRRIGRASREHAFASCGLPGKTPRHRGDMPAAAFRQNRWRRPTLTIVCERVSDEWLFALSDTDAVAATGRPSASSVMPDACWYAPSRYTLVRFDRS